MAARRGRQGGMGEARELAALLAALSGEDTAIDAAGIARRLGCSLARAKHLLMLLLQLQSSDETPLPLADEDGELERLQLFYGKGLRGRALRLSKSETTAILAALAQLGMSAGDTLIKKLSSAVLETSITAEDVQKTLRGAQNEWQGRIALCTQALAERCDLSFDYAATQSTAACSRRVSPRGLRPDGDHWYLDAFDHMRQGERVFRIDRMTNLQLAKAQQTPSQPTQTPTRTIEVTFHEDWPLLLFEWPGLTFADEKNRLARLPSFGGAWMVRHLAACGGSITIHDAEIARQVRAYASCEERHISR